VKITPENSLIGSGNDLPNRKEGSHHKFTSERHHKTASLIISAPIKINLALHITGKRADGFHNLESLVVFSKEGDRLSFRPGRRDSFRAYGSYAEKLGSPRSNLVLKARDALRQFYGREYIPPVSIHLEKNLPVAAGLGGGSADAAACLFGLMRLNGLSEGAELPENLPPLVQLAAELGADVPMCLAWFHRRSAFIARGKGEELEPLLHFPKLAAVVINNGTAISTRTVFGKLDKTESAPFPPAVAEARARSFDEWIALLKSLRNDLYPPALWIEPALSDALALLRESGAAFCAMSGSGASCFGIYPNLQIAQAAANFISRRHPDYFCLATETDGADV